MNRTEARFCDACGNAIQSAIAHSAERRQLTALFCDIVRSTPLARELDEEDLHRVVRAYQKKVVGVIERWGGHVEGYQGDGVTAYFGYPLAHEDDTERAVRAALEIVPAVGSLNLLEALGPGRKPPTLSVRIGINFGPVVVGELGAGELVQRQALGITMSVAARLQDMAQPGTVVISEATKGLVPGMFVTEELGLWPLKGDGGSVRAHVVRASTGVRSRLDTYSGYTAPVIGRERELADLSSCWKQVLRRHGQVVLISGEAGIGKSRLVRRFRELVSYSDDGRMFEWRCSPFHTGTPFHPIVESLEQHVGVGPGESRDQTSRRIKDALAQRRLHSEDESELNEASGLIAEMVSPGLQNADNASPQTADVRRSRTLDLLCDLVRAQANRVTTILTVEDVHWADPSSLELLGLLIERCGDVPVLLLLTFRPDFVPPWESAANVHALSLEPLTPTQCGELFDAMVGPRAIPAGVRDELLSRADGVPLFVEELTRTVLEPRADAGPKVLSAIPNTLRGLLVSRLDRLSPGAVTTIHLASALSREFRFDLLASVSARGTDALRADLQELVRSGLVYRRRALVNETYVFKHALVADAAYDSMLRSDRRRLHGQIAGRLREAFSSIAAEQPELLAHHYQEAGEAETAVDLWKQAGDNALLRGAYKEAVSHFDRGLELVPQLSNTGVRLQHEIELTESKGRALFSMLGYAHPDVESTFARASALCEQDGCAPPLRVLYGLWAVHISRSNREAVEALLPRFEDLASSGDPVALQTGHAHAGAYAFFTGNFEQCLQRMTEASRFHSTSWFGAGLYPFAYRMWSLSIMGRFDQATAAGDELQALAEQSRDPYGLAIAAGFRINVARDRRDLTATLQLAERQIAYTQRQLLPFWEGPAHCSRGWARASLGEVADGIAEITLGLRFLDAAGLRSTYAYQLGGLAEALLAGGDAEGAIAAAQRGLSMCETALDRFYEAELLRLLGEAKGRLGDLAAAQSAFERALELARRQSATLFALRAAASLAPLRTSQGRPDLARQDLESVLSCVSEGFEISDVVAVRELLAACA
jgi:class 3 adenylate cyclase/tetratricopeptide (TPR) repeat protein